MPETGHENHPEATFTGTVLVTGAAGYVGGRLVEELLDRDHRVRAMVIDAADSFRGRWPGAEVVNADVRDEAALGRALAGVDVAYYLIHSLLPCSSDELLDSIDEAVSFSRAARAAGIQRIIYLGSLLDTRAPAGSCQAGRTHVADELRDSGVPLTELRADIVIGSGSASYEILCNLVRRLPLMLLPDWSRRRRHLPIWVGDVVGYLAGALEEPATAGGSFELCGEELTYEQMLRQAGEAVGRKTRFVPFPFRGAAFYAYVASLLTPVPDELARAVIGGLDLDVGCRDRSLDDIVPRQPLSFAETLERAQRSELDGHVISRWSDAWPHEFEHSLKLSALKGQVDREVSFSVETAAAAADLFATVSDIGGESGWLHDNWMWRLRGGFDRVIRGAGIERGRKRHGRLEVNDVIDFWRVESIDRDRRLLLRAEMRLPGQGWLEFIIDDTGERRRLTVTAYFISRGLLGRLYWYAFYPFHRFIFRRLLAAIVERGSGRPSAAI